MRFASGWMWIRTGSMFGLFHGPRTGVGQRCGPHGGEAAATYQMTEMGEIITIDRSGFGNTMALVGTIAHELAMPA